MDSPKKILTIDGGGWRGVFAAAIIDRIEKAAEPKAPEIFHRLAARATGPSSPQPSQQLRHGNFSQFLGDLVHTTPSGIEDSVAKALT